MNKSYALSQLNKMVRDAIDMQLPDEYWVEAELSECREHNGHCYLELIEKDEHTNTPVARASAKCWRQTWLMVKPYFERTTGEPLRTGMKVLLKVYAQFHEAFGFSWIVTDIDPNYTLGDMARKRLEIIRQLKEEGVFDLQRELHIPLFAKRIAVISAENAAGYGDFCRQLEDNEYGFRFEVTLFPAIMQGEQVEQSIIGALERIYALTASFDVVVIIRGGGATADLSGFDTLALAENVANFPLPIITGIGHDRDESVLDMVSFRQVKTPTAAAAFLIDHLTAVLNVVDDCQQRVAACVSRRMQMEQLRLGRLAEKIPVLFSLVKTQQTARLDQCYLRITSLVGNRLTALSTQLSTLNTQLATLSQRRLQREQHRLDMLAQRVQSLDPNLLLRRGYSITLKDGRAVRSADNLQPGDIIETRLAEGRVRSKVEKK